MIIMNLLNFLASIFRRSKKQRKTIMITIKDKTKIPDYILQQYVTFASNYRLQIFDNNDCKKFLKKHYGNKFVEKFDSFQMGCHKADFFRYAYLFKMGGIYLDVKTILIRHLDDIFVDQSICHMVRSVIENSIYNGIIYTPPQNNLFHILMMDMFYDDTLNIINYLKPTYQMYNILKLFTSDKIVLGKNKLIGCCDLMIYEERDIPTIDNARDRHGWNTYVMKDSAMLFKVRDNRYVPNYDRSCETNKSKDSSKAEKFEIKHPVSNSSLVMEENDMWMLRQNNENSHSGICNLDSYSNKPESKTKEIVLKSRSMFGQDAMILDLFKFKRDGYYVDIGSGEGDRNNNTYLLDVEFGWKGLCIDPYPLRMKGRKNKMHKGVVYHTDTELEFVNAGLKSGIRNYGSEKQGPVVYREAVRTEYALEKACVPTHVDYLSVSVEGAELSVLRGVDFDVRRFEAITVNIGKHESNAYDVTYFLQSKGYSILRNYHEGFLFVPSNKI